MSNHLNSPENISKSLEPLYSCCKTLPIDKFQQWVIDDWLGQYIPHDDAVWVVHAKDKTIHKYNFLSLYPEAIADWELMKDEDAVTLAYFAQVGTAINSADLPGWQQSKSYQSFYDKYNVRQALAIACANDENNLLHIISQNRSDARKYFTESERQFLQTVAPHCVNALNLCNRISTGLDTVVENKLSHITALIDRAGVIHQSTGAFDTFLKKEWNAWHGHKIPKELHGWLLLDGQVRQGNYQGDNINIEAHLLDDFILLTAIEQSPLDKLTERERSIINLLCDGLSYKEIARILSISPSTVRNHIAKSYIRLGVNNKSTLLKLAKKAKK